MNVPLHSLSGPRTLHLFQRATIEIEQRLVRVNESSIRVQNNHVLRKEVDKLSKFVIGLSER